MRIYKLLHGCRLFGSVLARAQESGSRVRIAKPHGTSGRPRDLMLSSVQKNKWWPVAGEGNQRALSARPMPMGIEGWRNKLRLESHREVRLDHILPDHDSRPSFPESISVRHYAVPLSANSRNTSRWEFDRQRARHPEQCDQSEHMTISSPEGQSQHRR